MASEAFDRLWLRAYRADAAALIKASELAADGMAGTPLELVNVARGLLESERQFNTNLGLTPEGDVPGEEEVLVAETFFYKAKLKDLPPGAIEQP